MRLPADATLIVIDAQEAIGDLRQEPRDQSDAEAKGAALIAAWRAEGLPLVHVRHNSVRSGASEAPREPRHRFKSSAAPLEGESVIGKTADSAFVGTGLEALLDDVGATTLVLCGALASNSLGATARHASDLGYSVFVVADACWTAGTVDLTEDRKGNALSLARLQGEYARLVDAATTLNAAATAKARQRRAAEKA